MCEKAFIHVYYTDLSAYTAGIAAGAWLDVSDDIDDQINEITAHVFPDLHDGIAPADHEIFITDYDTNLKVSHGEYLSIDDLYQLQDLVNVINDQGLDPEIANVILENAGGISEAIKTIQNGDYSVLAVDSTSDLDLGWAAAEAFDLLHNCPDLYAQYFDYAAYGRDYRLDTTGDFSDNGAYYVSIY